jgi:MAF protein
MPPHLILASASQRRQQFFRELGLDHTIVVADIDETPLPAEEPAALALRLAEAKARAVAERIQAALATGDALLIVASDTVVTRAGVLYGKPEDGDDAVRMLEALRATVHEVITGISVLALPAGAQRSRLNRSCVTMRDYAAAEIAAYVATGDPMDKAGAYAIQSSHFAPVQSIDGCYSSIMGLPLADLCGLLAEHGVQCPVAVSSVCALHTTQPCCAHAQGKE